MEEHQAEAEPKSPLEHHNRRSIGAGKAVRLTSRAATVVGVPEPCVPYPQDTEIIANVVTSPHHLSATMVTNRVHRAEDRGMTDVFARLTPATDLRAARAELDSVYEAKKRKHPEAYPSRTDYRIRATLLRDELTKGARTILLVLMAASVLVFVIACSNVANLILARTVRRDSKLRARRWCCWVRRWRRRRFRRCGRRGWTWCKRCDRSDDQGKATGPGVCLAPIILVSRAGSRC